MNNLGSNLTQVEVRTSSAIFCRHPVTQHVTHGIVAQFSLCDILILCEI